MSDKYIHEPSFRPRLRGQIEKAYNKLTRKESRILIIGDIHEPFCLQDYLEFCLTQYKEHNCNQVIFIGDIIDNHYSSFHGTDPEGMGGTKELAMTIEKVAEWYKAFPKATVIIGNHDRIIMRKAFASDVPAQWIRGYNEVLKTPNWNWTERIVFDNVQYIHGESGQAKAKAKNDMMSTVQGHLHSLAYIEWFAGIHNNIFAMQVGCGVDVESYAMAYAKGFKKPVISCGIVIGGHTAINVLMNTRKKK